MDLAYVSNDEAHRGFQESSHNDKDKNRLKGDLKGAVSLKTQSGLQVCPEAPVPETKHELYVCACLCARVCVYAHVCMIPGLGLETQRSGRLGPCS